MELIDSIVNCLDPDSNYIKEENCSLLIDYTKLQIKMKLCNPPRTETFGEKHVLEKNDKYIQDNCNILKETEKYIMGDSLNIYELNSLRGNILKAGLKILRMES